MDSLELARTLKQYLVRSYPDIEVRVQPSTQYPSRREVCFIEKKFAPLYSMQRYHYLVNLIPHDFIEKYQNTMIWYELAPGESPHDLIYPDEAMIKSITPDVMKVLVKSGFFQALDEAMSPVDGSKSGEPCHGDFRITKRILKQKGFTDGGENDEIFDICHVLMEQGGYCDCEILFNIPKESRLRKRYEEKRARDLKSSGSPMTDKSHDLIQ